jgi:hypothetical protein
MDLDDDERTALTRLEIGLQLHPVAGFVALP